MRATSHQQTSLLLLLAAAVASAQPPAVTGTALYRERIALPPQAVLEIFLEDVSLADAPAKLLGSVRRDPAGNPPYQFSIPYNPSRIDTRFRYAVRARIIVDGALWFTTDEHYAALTQGAGEQLDRPLILKRVGQQTPAAIPNLPATYAGTLPCADCPGIQYTLNLYPENYYIARLVYTGKKNAKPYDEIGRWSATAETLTLIGGERAEQFAIKGPGTLQKLDGDGKPIQSRANYTLRRQPAFRPIEPNLALRGLFRQQSDAARFTECRSGRTFAVRDSAAYKEAEAAYSKYSTDAAPVMMHIQAKLAESQNAEGKQVYSVAIERFDAAYPGETCGEPMATYPLENTYWKLTMIGKEPVILAPGRREPHLVLRPAQNRLTGFGGCNTMAGEYQRKENEIRFGQVASTLMACLPDSPREDQFLAALRNVRSWRIQGQILELLDAAGAVAARFEARVMR